MNDLSLQTSLHSTTAQNPRVAVLVDGENVSYALAEQIVRESGVYGELVIRRVYGNAAKLAAWDTAPEFRLVHSGIGKNATDILLAVEAVSLMLTSKADILVLVASDRDYTHVAAHLREAGHKIIGLGEEKAPEAFRKSCSKFVLLTMHGPAQVVGSASAKPLEVLPVTLEEKIIALIHAEGKSYSMPIGLLSGRMHAAHKIKISTTPEKTWRAFLLARPQLFRCDPRSSAAKVNLV